MEMLLAWIQVSVELAWMGLQWHECSVNCIDRRVADVPISMEGFVTGVREAGDGVGAYAALAEHWYNVCWAWMLDCVLPGKDFCGIRGIARLVVSLFVSLMTKCLYRIHEWNDSEELGDVMGFGFYGC